MRVTPNAASPRPRWGQHFVFLRSWWSPHLSSVSLLTANKEGYAFPQGKERFSLVVQLPAQAPYGLDYPMQPCQPFPEGFIGQGAGHVLRSGGLGGSVPSSGCHSVSHFGTIFSNLSLFNGKMETAGDRTWRYPHRILGSPEAVSPRNPEPGAPH